MKTALYCLLFVALLGCVSCSKKVAVTTTARDQAFQTASAEIKGYWEKASEAIRTNDYVGGMVMLQQLSQNAALNAEQKKAVGEAMTALQDNIYEGVNRGDAKAQEALKELRKLRGR